MAGMEHSSILELPRANRGKPATGKPATPAAATARETAKPPEAAKPPGKRKLYSGSEPPKELPKEKKGRAPPRGRGKEEEKGGSKKSKKRKPPLSTRKGSAGSGSGSDDDDDDSKDEDWEASESVEKETSGAARLLGRNDYRGPSGKKRERR